MPNISISLSNDLIEWIDEKIAKGQTKNRSKFISVKLENEYHTEKFSTINVVTKELQATEDALFDLFQRQKTLRERLEFLENKQKQEEEAKLQKRREEEQKRFEQLERKKQQMFNRIKVLPGVDDFIREKLKDKKISDEDGINYSLLQVEFRHKYPHATLVTPSAISYYTQEILKKKEESDKND